LIFDRFAPQSVSRESPPHGYEEDRLATVKADVDVFVPAAL
jgi:hypothetical protein